MGKKLSKQGNTRHTSSSLTSDDIPTRFSRLPESVQLLVVEGLDAEVIAGFERIERALLDFTVQDEEIRSIEGDITRAAELRSLFTGKELVL